MRKFIVLLLFASSLAIVSPVAIEPAEAATPRCHGVRMQRLSGGNWGEVPVRSSRDSSKGCILARGDRTGAVITLQRTLNRCYGHVIGDRLSQDGWYGLRTAHAVYRVQKSLRVVRADAVFGPETSRHMRHLATSGLCAYS